MQMRDEKGRFCKKAGSKLITVVGWKGFDSDFSCRGKQYKEGETFTEDAAIMCVKGLHYCINPVEIFYYYNLFDDSNNIIKVANVTGKVRYRDIVKDFGIRPIDSKVVTTELRIDKVWNALDFLRIYAPRGLDQLYITYYPIGSNCLVLDGTNAARSIYVDNRGTFVMHNANKQLLTNASKNLLGMTDGTIYCARSRSLLDFTGYTCRFAGVAGVQYILKDTEGKTLFEGHIGNDGDLLPNTMYRFDARKEKLLIDGVIGATHL